MQFLWRYVDDLVGKGLELSIILEFLFYAGAGLVNLAAPLAVLLSSLMTFGSLGEQYELIAMKAAGISIKKLIFSLSIFALIISCGTFWFSDNVSPKAYIKMKTLLRSIVDQKPTLSIEEGVFYSGFDNFIIRVGKKDRNNVDIYDVLIFDHTNYQGNTTFTYAKKGKMEINDDKTFMLFYLYDGFFWDDSSNNNNSSNYPLRRSTFAEQYKRFDISSFKFEKYDNDDDFYTKSKYALSNEQLMQMIDTAMVTVNQNNDNSVEAFLTTCTCFNHILNSNSSTICSHLADNHSYNLGTDEMNEVLNKTIILKNNFVQKINANIEYNSFFYGSINSYYAEWMKKLVFAVACILFFFIGAPLGSIIRKGGIGVPLVVTVTFFSTFFMLSIFGEKIAKSGTVPVWFGMWLSTLIILPVCTFLTYQASADSTLLSSEELLKRIKQISLKKIFGKKNNEGITTHS